MSDAFDEAYERADFLPEDWDRLWLGDWVKTSEGPPDIGRNVMLWRESWGRARLGYYDSFGRYRGLGAVPIAHDSQPTHWMALPTEGPKDET